jgi:uncharacterized protein YwqG
LQIHVELDTRNPRALELFESAARVDAAWGPNGELCGAAGLRTDVELQFDPNGLPRNVETVFDVLLPGSSVHPTSRATGRAANAEGPIKVESIDASGAVLLAPNWWGGEDRLRVTRQELVRGFVPGPYYFSRWLAARRELIAAPLRRREELANQPLSEDSESDTLHRLVRPTLAIRFEDEDPDDPLETFAGGEPYAEEGEEWPHCGECGSAMPLVFQAEVPSDFEHWPIEHRAFTLFYCWSCHTSGKPPLSPAPKSPSLRDSWERRVRLGHDEGWLLRTYRRFEREKFRSTWDEYRYVHRDPRRRRAHFELRASLPDRVSTSLQAEMREQLGVTWSRDTVSRNEKEIARIEAVKTMRLGSHLGGYPKWTNLADETPTCHECEARMRLLVELKSEPLPGLSWADTGQIDVFVCPDHTTSTRLVLDTT